MSTATAQTTQVYSLYIRATPEAIWDAITKPEFTAKYFHGGLITSDAERRRSLGSDGSVRGDTQVAEWDPPRRLVHGWRSLYDPPLAAE